MTSYAVILTHNRPEMLNQCIDAISPQVDWVHVVDNASEPPASRSIERWPLKLRLYREMLQPPNLAKFWNDRLDYIQKVEEAKESSSWDVAFLCDDAMAPPGWFEAAAGGMRAFGATAGCTHAISSINDHIVKYAHDNDVMNRITGWAFVLAGEKGIRADETMQWWWCDSDIDWQARVNGGMVISPGPVVVNDLPNAWTNGKPELGTRAGLDRAAFAAKWGSNPW